MPYRATTVTSTPLPDVFGKPRAAQVSDSNAVLPPCPPHRFWKQAYVRHLRVELESCARACVHVFVCVCVCVCVRVCRWPTLPHA